MVLNYCAIGLERAHPEKETRSRRSSRASYVLVAMAICVSLMSTTAGCRPGIGGRDSDGAGLAGLRAPVAPPPGKTSGGPRGERPYDENVEVPPGDPAFPALGRFWVVDPDGLVGPRALEAADETLEALRADGLAETVIVVQRGVKRPADWSTHYGRWLMLGEREGPRMNNGLVFLIIPDARPEAGRVWYSVGRGLPRLTSSDLGPLIEEAASYANAGDLDGAVVSIARNIDDILRKVYGRGEQ
ncbi:MAG: TPM domain-containing protein [Bacillota bacterium]